MLPLVDAPRTSRERVGLAGVLETLDRQAVRVPVPGLAVAWGFTWNEHDRDSPRWWPQGITTSAEAGRADLGRAIVVTSAYSREIEGVSSGSRVTFTDLESLRYRNVLLVEDTPDGGWSPLHVHAGGLAWYGEEMYVAGTRRGLYVFRIDDLTRVADGPFGYEYVLPVHRRFDAGAEHRLEAMRYSFVSLDVTADVPHLVAGEYGKDAMATRLVRWALDGSSPQVEAVPGVGHMQGATVVDGTWYVTSSRGQWGLGSMYVGEPGAFVEHRQALPTGPEDISYWPEQDAFWSLSEYPGRRWVFQVPRSLLVG